MTFVLKYPKINFLLIIIVFSILLFFKGHSWPPLHDFLLSLDLLGIFLGGVLYAYGFTAPVATAVLLILAREHNIFIAGFLGGFGALVSDLIIFQFVKNQFTKEIQQLQKEQLLVSIRTYLEKRIGYTEAYVIPVSASLLIASPLPTEIGVVLLASLKTITVKRFIWIAYGLHTFGIFVILLLGNLLL